MSLITHWNRNTTKHPFAARIGLRVIIDFMQHAIVSVAKVLMRAADIVAEERMRKAEIAVERYRRRNNRFLNNDDDLTTVR
jgi:hypothetical protein